MAGFFEMGYEMKKCIYFLLAVILTGCGSEHDLTADLELRVYLDQYLKIAPNEGHLADLTELKFGTPPNGRIGFCYATNIAQGTSVQVSLSRKIVVIRPEDIPVTGGRMDARFGAVVMHELGHCLHDKKHSNEPDSIMSPKVGYAHDEAWWSEHLDEKIAEMFK